MSNVRKWAGELDGDRDDAWSLEVDYDCYTDGEPFVVDLWCGWDQNPQTAQGAFLTPKQAREVAAALTKLADAVETVNAERGLA